MLKPDCLTSSFRIVFQSFWVSTQKLPSGNEGLSSNSSCLTQFLGSTKNRLAALKARQATQTSLGSFLHFLWDAMKFLD